MNYPPTSALADDILAGGLVEGAEYVYDSFWSAYGIYILVGLIGITVGFVTYKLVRRALNKI